MLENRDVYSAAFHEAAGNKTEEEGGDLMVHVTCFSEELTEFNEALADYLTNPTEETRAEMIKEWADVQFTLSSFPWYFDFDGENAISIVGENNLSKIDPETGEVKRREDGKILKPEGYQKPDMRGL